MMNTKKQLIEQVKLVLKVLEEDYQSNLNSGVIELIYKRYKNALDILETNKDIDDIYIEGGVRAYLDAHNDFDNPLLEEMHKSEKLLNKLSQE
jgi:hypothetical protein